MAEEKINPNEEMIEFGSEKQIDEYELIEEGKYEVILEKIESKESNKNGKITKFLNLMFTIRKDVKQNFQNRKIWYTIFARENDRAFNFNQINSLIITQEGRPDYKRHFQNLDEILQYLVGLHMIVQIGIEFNKFKSKDDNIIVDGTFEPSQWDMENHTQDKESLTPIDIPDDDLPF